MNLRQLRLFCQVVDCKLNVSRAAHAIHTSQPNVSRHLHALEQELGIGLFVRSKKRILALTDAGNEVMQSARRVIREIESIGRIGKTDAGEQKGNLTIAASQAQIRYSLPGVIKQFTKRHPKVRLVLQEGDPDQVTSRLSQGQADIAITSELNKLTLDLALFPCHRNSRVLLVPKRHPLAKLRKPTFEQLAKHPLITYSASFSIYHRVERAFAQKGLVPNIVLSTTDVEVMKTYIRLGLGVAIVSSIAFSAAEDKDLRAIDVGHLFEPNFVGIGLRKGTYLKPYVYDFIELFSPALHRDHIEAVLFKR